MRQVRSIGFEGLEGRMLLSRGHHARVHVAAVAPPLMLDGTLAVNNGGAATTMNPDGSTTTVTAVSGTLGTLGAVHGTWDVTVDSSGNNVGPDTMRVRNASGSVLLAFDELSPGPIHRVKHGPASMEHGLQVVGGTGAYAHASGIAAITMTTNNARTGIVSLAISPRKP
ncbi:MAG TPA: hypothetical protein VG406_23265 [Isosphaeraceae bacterium]|jgi:hypothetical protein|nr:hypothetical protein [Isosphaeraceae bacterium]